MATIVNNPNGQDNGMTGVLIGVILLVVVIILFVLFGLPAIRGTQPDTTQAPTTNVNLPDVNVQTPQQPTTGSGENTQNPPTNPTPTPTPAPNNNPAQ